jgi:TolA protein
MKLEQSKPFTRFIVASTLVHVLSASAILFSNQSAQREQTKELVEVEFAAPVGPTAAPEVAPVPEQAAPQPIAAVQTTAQEPEPVKPAASQPATPKQIPVVKQNKPTLTPVTEKVDAEVAAAPAETMDSQEVDQALDQADAEQNQQLQKATDQMNDEAEKAKAASDAEVAAQIKKQNEDDAAKLAAHKEELKKEEEQKQQAAEAAKIAAAKEAKEKADAEAKAENDRLAAEKAAEAAAAEKEKQEALAAAETAKASGEGDAQKNAGPGAQAGEVRALEQLRQMPGNPKPSYSEDERLQGHQGMIVFQAFVTQEGQLTNFKLLKSTGHKNLDAKTLKALKQWKFYPGQEGWVELPFDWNLKGGPQEMPTYLRRKVGQTE